MSVSCLHLTLPGFAKPWFSNQRRANPKPLFCGDVTHGFSPKAAWQKPRALALGVCHSAIYLFFLDYISFVTRCGSSELWATMFKIVARSVPLGEHSAEESSPKPRGRLFKSGPQHHLLSNILRFTVGFLNMI